MYGKIDILEENKTFKEIYALRKKMDGYSDCRYIKFKDKYIIFASMFLRDNTPISYSRYKLKKLFFNFVKNHDCLVYMWLDNSDLSYTTLLSTIEKFDIDPSKFYIWLASEEDIKHFKNTKFNYFLINRSSFVPLHTFTFDRNIPKQYNLVYNGNLPVNGKLKKHYKRWDICPTSISDIAVIDGNVKRHANLENRNKNLNKYNINYSYINDQFLLLTEVARIYQKSKVGIILSLREGGCFASQEYLACGLPVVSTKSISGRNLYYDKYNSIVCEPTKEAVTEVCLEMIRRVENNEIDGEKIRNDFIKRMNERFTMWKRSIQDGFERLDIEVDFEKFFNEIFLNKFGEIKYTWSYLTNSYEIL